MEAWIAKGADRGEVILWRDRGIHRSCGLHELPAHQSDEGSGLRRDRTGHFDSASYSDDHANQQQPENHGCVGEWTGYERARMADDDRHVPGRDWTSCRLDLVTS